MPTRSTILHALWLLLVLEGTLRIVMSADPVLARLERLGETGRRYAVVARYRAGAPDGGAEAMRAVTASPLQHDPRRGWAMRPGSWIVDGVPHTVHAQGYRGDPAGPRREGHTRVVTLGDSFTYGDEVGDADTWTARLGQTPGIEALNLGVSGYGHDQMLLTWRQDGAALAPDVVLLAFLPPDVSRNVDRFTTWRKPVFLQDAGGLTLTGAPVPPADAVARAHDLTPRVLDVARVWWDVWEARSGAERAAAEARTVAILATLRDEVTAAGARLVLVYGPEPADWAQTAPTDAAELFAALCAGGHDCADATPAFRAAAAEGPLMRFTHWNAAGHRAFAGAARAALIARGLAPDATVSDGAE